MVFLSGASAFQNSPDAAWPLRLNSAKNTIAKSCFAVVLTFENIAALNIGGAHSTTLLLADLKQATKV
jgi:hypothetical protein